MFGIQQMKKLPPYGKPLADLLKSGFRPDNDIYLFIGQAAWEGAAKHSKIDPVRTLCLPPFDEPYEYKWPVQQCYILILDTGYGHDDYANDLAYYLYEDGALIVRWITYHLDVITFNR